MPIAVATAPRSHTLASVFRGRSRAVSEAGPSLPHELETPNVAKSASYTYFPRVKGLYHEPNVVQLREQPEDDSLELPQCPANPLDLVSQTPSPEPEEPPDAIPQMKLHGSRRQRFLPFSNRSRDASMEPKPDRKPSRSPSQSLRKSHSPSASPARSSNKLSRRSWILAPQQPTSSSSPTKERRNQLTVESHSRQFDSSSESIPEDWEARDTVPADSAPIFLGKKITRLSTLLNATAEVPATPAIPKSFSTEKLPLYPNSATSLSPTSAVPPLPRNPSGDKLNVLKKEPRKRDELWGVFRTLDGDLRKFHSKSIALKANVIRTTLLPFLRQYLAHPSFHRLGLEDLDRRVNILNGWWTALLELVAGRNNHSISGTDRPIILDGITAIMERPEWRRYPPLSSHQDREETSSAATSLSNNSTSSDFLAESVHHNIRNVFTQNLLSQMAFVVEKMSLRNAAASLVTFCGKTCAYAFCFCPSIADLLVRLWNPSLDMMKRVLDESGVSKKERLDAVSDRIARSFPPMLQSLQMQSPHKLLRLLRRPALPPLAVAHLDWHGLWTKRWSGAESDLFYVFVKHYHIIIADYLLVKPSNVERVCIPAFTIIHAQILVNLDAAIFRHTTPQQLEENATSTAPITFDDVLEPDVSAAALAIPPVNATRAMAENRLIMLVRDFLSEQNAHVHVARHIFAESFARLLQAQARKISIYDSSACYILCDFLEEALTIMFRYEYSDSEQQSLIDWDFWLVVYKSMTESHNTSTEIKLYSFLYCIWPTLTVDNQRRTNLCHKFLLEPEFFESRFNHWCPMVRAYYMRLLCWRVARFDGEDTQDELDIKRALSDRLRETWSHYLWLCLDAERRNAILPSTQACNPAPGRRFLIIRNDNPANANHPFLSFDGVMQHAYQKKPPPPLTATTTTTIQPVLAQSAELLDFPDEEVGRGRWNILRNFIGSGTKQVQKPKIASTDPKEKENVSKADTFEFKLTTESVPHTEAPTPAAPTHRSYNFRFSLEWVDRRFSAYQNMRLHPPRLPLSAQSYLHQKLINTGPVVPAQPLGPAAISSTYAGRALAEWTFVSHECQNFYDRRRNEGVPGNWAVETPALAVEVFRRPG